jgi:16S rRNA (uracil1498-N3)-methyltransferase
LEPPVELAVFAGAAARSDARLCLLDPEADVGFGDLDAGRPVVIAIGPEGGFSDRDRAVLGLAGFDGVRLGPRVLRTETAGLAALAVLQARAGDFR